MGKGLFLHPVIFSFCCSLSSEHYGITVATCALTAVSTHRAVHLYQTVLSDMGAKLYMRLMVRKQYQLS